jgi:hypothetical protein
MVVNKHTHTKTALDVYIGRGSVWGNRFSHREGTRAEVVVGSREAAVEAYRRELWAKIKSGEVSLESLAALHGRTLVCFCAPRLCHGHTLEKAAAWASRELEAQDACFHAQCDHDICAYEMRLRAEVAHVEAQVGDEIAAAGW